MPTMQKALQAMIPNTQGDISMKTRVSWFLIGGATTVAAYGTGIWGPPTVAATVGMKSFGAIGLAWSYYRNIFD